MDSLSDESLVFLSRLADDVEALIELAAVSKGKKPVGHIHTNLNLQDRLLMQLLRDLRIPVWKAIDVKAKVESVPLERSSGPMIIGITRDHLKDVTDCVSFPYVKRLDEGNEAFFQLSEGDLAMIYDGKKVRSDKPLLLADWEISKVGLNINSYQLTTIAVSFQALSQIDWAINLPEKKKIDSRHSLNEQVGLALGYPRCCVETYNVVTNIPGFEEAKFLIHYPLSSYLESEKLKQDENHPPEFKFILHTPCSPKCEKSIELGRSYAEAVKKTYPNSLVARAFVFLI